MPSIQFFRLKNSVRRLKYRDLLQSNFLLAEGFFFCGKNEKGDTRMEGLFEAILQLTFEFVFELIGEIISEISEWYLNGRAAKINLPFSVSFSDEITKLDLFN